MLDHLSFLLDVLDGKCYMHKTHTRDYRRFENLAGQRVSIVPDEEEEKALQAFMLRHNIKAGQVLRMALRQFFRLTNREISVGTTGD
jgi:hypothetical protein